MATASCTKRPRPLSGTAVAAPSAGTSKTYPCGWVNWLAGRGSASVSSYAQPRAHGVGPPAQLRVVPHRLAHAFVTNPRSLVELHRRRAAAGLTWSVRGCGGEGTELAVDS